METANPGAGGDIHRPGVLFRSARVDWPAGGGLDVRCRPGGRCHDVDRGPSGGGQDTDVGDDQRGQIRQGGLEPDQYGRVAVEDDAELFITKNTLPTITAIDTVRFSCGGATTIETSSGSVDRVGGVPFMSTSRAEMRMPMT